MRIQDIMNSMVKTVPEDYPADDALYMMNMYEIHHLVVMNGEAIVGIVSHRNLNGPGGIEALKGLIVADLMQADIVTVAPNTLLHDAANLMRGYGIGCLPVVEEGKLVGIITISDLLELLGRGYERSVIKKERRHGVDMPAYTRMQH